MKEFIVIRVYQCALPDVVASFEGSEDAHAYANLSKLNDTKHDYIVAQLCTTDTTDCE